MFLEGKSKRKDRADARLQGTLEKKEEGSKKILYRRAAQRTYLGDKCRKSQRGGRRTSWENPRSDAQETKDRKL